MVNMPQYRARQEELLRLRLPDVLRRSLLERESRIDDDAWRVLVNEAVRENRRQSSSASTSNALAVGAGLEEGKSLAGSPPPEFTIKATDELACVTITCWLSMARYRRVSKEKIESAEKVLLAAREWQRAHPDKVKVPD